MIGVEKGTGRKKVKKSSIIIITVLSVVIIVVVLVVLFARLPSFTGAQKISVGNVSLKWEYNEFAKGYILKKATLTLTNNGDSPMYDLYIFGQVDGKTFGGLITGTPSLKSGETRTFSYEWGGITITQPGSYTLTLRVEDGMRELLGQRTMTIQVP